MIKTLLGVSRLNFLTLTLLCIVLAAAFSRAAGAELVWGATLLVAGIAFAAHISVNAFNEYFDFRSGLDYLTVKTPFSGGSGTLLKAPEQAFAALALAWFSLILVVVAGLYLTTQYGWQLLLIGVPGALLIYTYTQYVNRSAIICLLAPGIGFGLMMTLGAIWVLQQELTAGAWVLAFLVACLTNNLLLLNQFPDRMADQQVGRKTLPIVWGEKASLVVFVTQYMAAFLLLLLAVFVGWLPPLTLLTLATLPIFVKLVAGVRAHVNEKQEQSQLTTYLAINVFFIHLFLLLLIITIHFSSGF